LFHLTKNLTTHLSHNLCAVLPKETPYKARPFPPLSTRVYVEKWIKLWKTFFTREMLAEIVPAGQGKYGA
jgi:hypothetical protein